MAGRAVQSQRTAPSLSIASVEDAPTQRALEQVQDAVSRLQGARSRDVRTVDLVVGTNIVRHGLGRAVLGYTLTPTFATLAFAHAINLDNPRPELEVWIDVVGSDQDGARLEIW